MIDYVKITNKDGSTFYQLNDNEQAPLQMWDPSINRRVDTSRERSQGHGINPTVSLKGGMELHLEGALFADNTTDYFVQHDALVLAVEGDPNLDPDNTVLYDLILAVRRSDQTEDWITQSIVSEFTAPIKALYPSGTEWALTLFSWTPWFVGHDTGTRHYWI